MNAVGVCLQVKALSSRMKVYRSSTGCHCPSAGTCNVFLLLLNSRPLSTAWSLGSRWMTSPEL